MEVKYLLDKWVLLDGDTNTSFKSLRLDSVIIPDLYIGVSQNRKRCLILKLPDKYIPDFQSSVKQNLSLELHKESKWIVLTLLDDQYYDLFDDLIVSIYYKISAISDTVLYVGELLKTYYKWSEFFQDSSGDILSEDQIKGLIGELIVLEERLKGASSQDINNVLSSWKGPYDTGHDFEGETINTEVKTKSISGVGVQISSEYQLLCETGKELELIVVSMERDPLEGISIKELLLRIREIIIVKLGDYTIILKSLAQKGLTLSNLEDYGYLKFRPLEMKTYDCDHHDFPRIIRTMLPDAISSVGYRLNLNEVQDFILNNKML